MGVDPRPQNRFAPWALLSTDLARDSAQVVAWFARRWAGVQVGEHSLGRTPVV